jgi:hypothetical protein
MVLYCTLLHRQTASGWTNHRLVRFDIHPCKQTKGVRVLVLYGVQYICCSLVEEVGRECIISVLVGTAEAGCGPGNSSDWTVLLPPPPPPEHPRKDKNLHRWQVAERAWHSPKK